MESVSILLIQETKKMAEDSLATLKNFCPKGEGFATSANEASGGLLCWWDSEKFVMHSATENRNWLFIKLENKEKKEMFWIGNIYGPTIQAQKESFWNSLEEQCDGKSSSLLHSEGLQRHYLRRRAQRWN